MRKLFNLIFDKVTYPYWLIIRLHNMVQEHDDFIEKINANNVELMRRHKALKGSVELLTAETTQLTEKMQRLNKTVAHQRKRHNTLTKRFNDHDT